MSSSAISEHRHPPRISAVVWRRAPPPGCDPARCRKAVKEIELSSKQLALAAAQCALKLKAEDVVLLDLRKLSPSRISSSSVQGWGKPRQGHQRCRARGIGGTEEPSKAWHVEGYESLRWVLLDYVNVWSTSFSTGRAITTPREILGDAPMEAIRDDPPAGGRGPHEERDPAPHCPVLPGPAPGLSWDEGAPFRLEAPRDPSHGDLASNVAMLLAGAWAAAGPAGRGPGGWLNARLAAGPGAGCGAGIPQLPLAAAQVQESSAASWPPVGLRRSAAGGGERVNVEFVSANPTGPPSS